MSTPPASSETLLDRGPAAGGDAAVDVTAAVRRLEEATGLPADRVARALRAALRRVSDDRGGDPPERVLEAAVLRAVVTLWAEEMAGKGRLSRR